MQSRGTADHGGAPGAGASGGIRGWWGGHVSLQFGLFCLASKLVVEAVGLEWTSLPALVGSMKPSMDALAFMPACVIAYDLCGRLPRALRAAAITAVVFAVAAFSMSDLLSLEFFHAHLASVFLILLRLHAITATQSDLMVLLPVKVLVALGGFIAAALWGFGRRRNSSIGLLGPAALVLLAFAVTANRDQALDATLARVTAGGLYYSAGGTDTLAEKPLHAAKHLKPVVLGGAPLLPRTIVIFVNESLPSFFASSSNPGVALFETMLTESGFEASRWHRFGHAFTNSSTTDISMPSLMTGADPTAGTDEVEELPFIYEMAKRRGYSTAFFTSQDYGWAQLRTYFTSEDLDEFLSGEKTKEPNVNLMGIDDMYVARRIVDYVARMGPDRRLFLVLNNNALHVPYQIESMIKVPGFARDAKVRAAFIIEQFYAAIFKGLREAGRLDDSLIFVTSDHGELSPRLNRDVVRLDSHFDEVVRVPFAIYLPASAPASLREALDANRERTVANMDIAPTLAGLLGVALPAGRSYPGYDLFKPVPKGRVTVSVTNNEWRPWHLNAFGVQSGDDRLVFNPKVGLVYYDTHSDPDEVSPQKAGAKFDSYRAYLEVHPNLPKWLGGTEGR